MRHLLLSFVLIVLVSCATTRASPSADDRCRAQECRVTIAVASCCAGPTYRWNGTTCVSAPCGCGMEGRDCASLYRTVEACEEAHRDCARTR